MQSILPLLLLISAALGIPLRVSTNQGGLPVIGDRWGPVITHAREMKEAQNGLLHEYYYPTENKEDVLADYILATEIFRNVSNMHKHVKSFVTDDLVVVEHDPAALEGNYLEVLSSKPIPPSAVKMMCHSYKTTPAFYHNLADTNHKVKLMYSMVGDVINGYLFPTVFFSHHGCTCDENDKESCYWVTHVNEIVVIDKRIVKF